MMKNMIPWTTEELLQSTAYGMLWLVMDVRGGKMHCRRLRRKTKDNQYFVYASEKKIFVTTDSAKKGEIIFQDAEKNVITLIPEPDTAMAKHIADVLKKGKL